jgi:hypothetical protein
MQIFEDGMTVKEIGIEYKAAVGTVEKWFAHYGLSRKVIKIDVSDDVNVGLATVVAIDTDDDGVITFAAPGGGVVVGAIAARILAEAMHFEMGGV